MITHHTTALADTVSCVMSVQQSPRSLKRDHDAFSNRSEPHHIPPDPTHFLEKSKGESEKMLENAHENARSLSTLGSMSEVKREPSPARSTTSSLSDAGPFTPSDISQSPMVAAALTTASSNTASPSAFAALNGNPLPPAKKAKLTFAEREEKRILKEIKEAEKATERAEKAAERAKKDAEKQANAAEKAQKDSEREAERKRKEADREEKRAAQEAEKAAKEEKRRKREEEKQKAEDEKKKKEDEKKKKEDEKKKKERSQKKLNSFFNIPSPAVKARRASADSKERGSVSPGPQNPTSGLPSAITASSADTPRKPERSCYQKTFPDFFVHSDVKLAKCNRFERDEDAVKAFGKTLDGYLDGSRSPGRQKHRAFDAFELFHLREHDSQRGKRCMPIRDIMAEFEGNASKPIDLTTDSQNSQIKRRQDLLRRVPLKLLHFAEDVRPPYRGTYTSQPVNGMTKLARNPLRRDLPNTNYDYDSEAEWVEDDDAEDCNSDGEEEEGDEDGEDMDGFLDDENDELANAKRALLPGNDLEPISTGLCWEDRHKRTTNVKMLPYRMETIIGKSLLVSNFCISDLNRPETKIHRSILNIILGA
jgi:chromatin assembly factor 1 subunit A